MGCFRFKRFSVEHDRSTMKVGTDAVLLGSWTEIPNHAKNILDIGSGCGVLALMLAQRTEDMGVHIDAVDCDEGSVDEMRQNFNASPWSARLTEFHGRVQEFAKQRPCRYDLIISNPPYFNDSLLPPHSPRAGARHTITLTFEELISSARRLLAENGVFSVIIPYDVAGEMIRIASLNSLILQKRTDVLPLPASVPRRSMLMFCMAGKGFEDNYALQDSIVIESGSRHAYTPEYRSLTGDFYLNF